MKKENGRRLCRSWISRFVEWTENVEAAPIFRKWSAITALAATLEQKVWVTTSSPLYPNIYTFLVGSPGIGKSRSINAALAPIRELGDLPIAATSLTMASLVDQLADAKRLKNLTNGTVPVEYNSMLIAPDEFSAFMSEHDRQLVAGLTTFYDCGPYMQARRTKDLRIGIQRPQLSILTGATPVNVLNVLPQAAWQQGLTSRIFFIYSDQRPLIDVFGTKKRPMPKELVHDLKLIAGLWGEFGWTAEYQVEMNRYRVGGLAPAPTHPRLESYCSRRYGHLIKLTMIANVDRSNDLMLDVEDYLTAKAWLLEAEAEMPKIFNAVPEGQDAYAMEEIRHFVSSFGNKGVSESRVVQYAMKRLKYAVHTPTLINVLIASGDLRVLWVDEGNGMRYIVATAYAREEGSLSLKQ